LALGWFYQNLVTVAAWDQRAIESVDLTNNLISPNSLIKSKTRKSAIKHFRPYTFLVSIAVPNYSRAISALSYNQTFGKRSADCLRFGALPSRAWRVSKMLDMLVPEFIAKNSARHHWVPVVVLSRHDRWEVSALLRRVNKINDNGVPDETGGKKGRLGLAAISLK